MGSIYDSQYFFFFFFWLRISGLDVSELPVMGTLWAWLCFIYIYSDFSSNFFLGFFFFFLLKSRIDNFFFFNLRVFLIFD